ncbi:hypothetical protein B0A48_11984 [Cryoendolithus antarcticus]|uniref:Uncharacterized protein n=1 Tax=Cryoendolithus antarcticus TaxID=1507870 RepID=A0A1V8STD5_9PEZI|nr:hypothetical protein B0A48_11984 [Cryoendolithus antarcticus]
MTNPRVLHEAFAAISSYTYDRTSPNSSSQFIQHPVAHSDPTKKFKQLIKLIKSPLKPVWCDVDATAVVASIHDPLADRMRTARVETTSKDADEAIQNHIKNRRRKCRDQGETLGWRSSDMERVLAKRFKQVLQDVLYSARERHHRKLLKGKGGSAGSVLRNHIDYFDEDSELIENACEKVSEIVVDMNIYDMSDWTGGARWPIMPEYAEYLDEAVDRYDATKLADSPCDTLDFIIAALAGEDEEISTMYRIRDLALEEVEKAEKIQKAHHGKESHVVGVHWQDERWSVTIRDPKTRRLSAVDFDKAKHTRAVLGPCIADNLANTSSVRKTRRYIELYRDLRNVVRKDRVSKRKSRARAATVESSDEGI